MNTSLRRFTASLLIATVSSTALPITAHAETITTGSSIAQLAGRIDTLPAGGVYQLIFSAIAGVVVLIAFAIVGTVVLAATVIKKLGQRES